MSRWITGGQIWRAAHGVPIACCLALGACAAAGDTGFLLLADPGKYQYYNCKQIESARGATLARQKDLKGLIDKAEEGTGGVLVGAIAYRTDYVAVNEELRTIEATAREKNCAQPPAPAAPPPAPTRSSDTAIQ